MGWWADWKTKRKQKKLDRQKEKELKAMEHLRTVLSAEKRRLNPLIAQVGKIEVLIREGKTSEAEAFIPGLTEDLRSKKILEQLGFRDFKIFRKTLLKELKAELQGI